MNEEREPVSSATITLKRTGASTISDENGEFSLSDILFQDTLLISAIGYQPCIETIDFSFRGPATIIMKRSAAMLSQVYVSTGYQVLPRERATGSFTFTDNKTLNLQQSSGIINRLEGVTNSLLFDKNPDRPALTVRGISTILSSKDPLVIVDNFPYEGDINTINPADVESVTILKDAAAASIWGTRAGNGVIVITTKTGRFNQPLKIEFLANATVKQKPDLFYDKILPSSDFIDVEQFLFSKGYYSAKELDNNRPLLSPVVELLIAERDGKITPAAAASEINDLRNIDLRHNYSDHMYRNGLNRQYALALKGGSTSHAWVLSLGYDDNISELEAKYRRLTMRSENLFRIGKKIRIESSVAAMQTSSSQGRPSYSSFFIGGLYPYPYARLTDSDGNPIPLYNYRQTYIDTAGAGKLLDWKWYPSTDYKYRNTKTVNRSFITRLGGRYQLLTALSLDMKYQFELQQVEGRNHSSLQSYFVRDMINRFSQLNRSTGQVSYRIPKGDILDLSNGVLQAHNLRGQLNFSKTWSSHHLIALLGTELRDIGEKSNSTRIYGYNDDLLSYLPVDFANPYPIFTTGNSLYIDDGISLSEIHNRFFSLYANGAYTLREKYTLSGSARRDASNVFGANTNNKTIPLWSIGTAWKISNEPFYNLEVLPQLNLRFTYGYSGNVALERSAVTTMTYFSGAQYTGFLNGRLTQFANPELRWEKLSTLNVGFDFTFRKEVLSGSLELYAKKGLDLFGNAPVDYTTGVGANIVKNVANMKGRGADLQLNLRTLKRPWSCETIFLFSYNSSRVTKYFNTSLQGSRFLSNGSSISALEGKPVYSILSYKWGGLDSLGNPVGIVEGVKSTNYADIAGIKTTVADLVYGGAAQPPYFGSVQNTISYKGFSITVNAGYKFGHVFTRESINYSLLFSSWRGHEDYAFRWQQPGDELKTSVPSMIYPASTQRDDFYRNAEVLVEKAGHIRLNFVNLSYSIQKPSSLKLSQLQVYINASSPGIIWRANHNQLDPEYGSAIPPGRSISFGFRASL